jgi:hypothetical protein
MSCSDSVTKKDKGVIYRSSGTFERSIMFPSRLLFCYCYCSQLHIRNCHCRYPGVLYYDSAQSKALENHPILVLRQYTRVQALGKLPLILRLTVSKSPGPREPLKITAESEEARKHNVN